MQWQCDECRDEEPASTAGVTGVCSGAAGVAGVCGGAAGVAGVCGGVAGICSVSGSGAFFCGADRFGSGFEAMALGVTAWSDSNSNLRGDALSNENLCTDRKVTSLSMSFISYESNISDLCGLVT